MRILADSWLRRQPTRRVAGLLAMGLLLSIGACSNRVGEGAPGFELPSADGETVSLEEHRGSVVLVSFWATWCGPCKQELPALHQLARRLEEDVTVLLVSTEELPRTRRFLEGRGIDLTSLWDDGGQVHSDYGVVAIPSLFVIDPDGVIRGHHVGYSQAVPAKLEAEIRELSRT